MILCSDEIAILRQFDIPKRYTEMGRKGGENSSLFLIVFQPIVSCRRKTLIFKGLGGVKASLTPAPPLAKLPCPRSKIEKFTKIVYRNCRKNRNPENKKYIKIWTKK